LHDKRRIAICVGICAGRDVKRWRLWLKAFSQLARLALDITNQLLCVMLSGSDAEIEIECRKVVECHVFRSSFVKNVAIETPSLRVSLNSDQSLIIQHFRETLSVRNTTVVQILWLLVIVLVLKANVKEVRSKLPQRFD
jgi:hypothetical protein